MLLTSNHYDIHQLLPWSLKNSREIFACNVFTIKRLTPFRRPWEYEPWQVSFETTMVFNVWHQQRAAQQQMWQSPEKDPKNTNGFAQQIA